MAMKSYEAFCDILGEAIRRFGGEHKVTVNDEKLSELRENCGYFDEIVKKFDGEYYDVKIDEYSKSNDITIAVGLNCSEFEATKNDGFYHILKSAKLMRTHQYEPDKIHIELVFDGVLDVVEA